MIIIPIFQRIAAFCLSVLFLWLIFWLPVRILRRAGYSRTVALLVLALGPFALIVLALNDWPIERELAWLKLQAGEPPELLLPLAEAHAVALEKRGDWSKAAEVYKTLIARSDSDEASNYYGNCLSRLGELAGHGLDG